jgi:hypothetical protein
MKKKVSKAGRNRRRQGAKDLTTAKSRDPKGGEVRHSDFAIVKRLEQGFHISLCRTKRGTGA